MKNFTIKGYKIEIELKTISPAVTILNSPGERLIILRNLLPERAHRDIEENEVKANKKAVIITTKSPSKYGVINVPYNASPYIMTLTFINWRNRPLLKEKIIE
ncbi:MAG: hypothetical protein PF693_10530 [Spirochaetia bacterium]|jgi:predicted secreted protein|nr:hypothetical protein [Spirochaetia bacterium]